MSGERDERLARLEREDAALEEALSQVSHDMRRCRDGLERAGWRSAALERRLRALEDERARLLADRERNRAQRRALAARREE